MSLLSVLYTEFKKIIAQIPTNKLNTYQPIELAGFTQGYMNHLQTIKTLIEKS